MIRALERSLTVIHSIPERIVDKIGMYRIVSGALVILTVLSFASSLFGFLAYSPLALLTSLTIALFVALGLNVLSALVWRVSANHESAVITALLLFFMMIPSESIMGNWQLGAGVALAIFSKYLIVYRNQHILNPAATGAVLLVAIVALVNLITDSSYNTDIFSWWVANPILLWPVLLLGTLVVFKVRKWTPVLWFVGVGLAIFLVESIRFEQPLLEATELYFVSYPTLFLAFFMLTEPFTMPPTRSQQAWYGGLVGALSSTTLLAPVVAMTPELALVCGNLFAYGFRIRQKLYLELIEKKQIARDTWEFVFKKPDRFQFQAGQYLEWMLPHEDSDSRGLRRYFTIASSPTESVVRLACKIQPEHGSSYKAALSDLDEGEVIVASQLAGDFLLPQKITGDAPPKLGFIAGGIGVTPFSSHVHFMADSGNRHDTVLYYCCNTAEDLAYLEDFRSLDIPLTVIPVLARTEASEANESGFVTVDMLDRRTPEWRERVWYLSGPPGMVNAYYELLRNSGIPRSQIKKDFFPGLA